MARRESRTSRGFSFSMEDMRREMEAERREMEEKLRVAAEVMLLKERERWSSERQQLLEEKNNLQEKLSISEGENQRLKANLQEAREEISALEDKFDTAIVAWWKQLRKEHEEAEDKMKKRDEQTVLLHHSLVTQQEENKKMRTSADKWQKEVSQLKELLTERDAQKSRASIQRLPAPTPSSASNKTLRPTRHPNTSRKNTDWFLDVREKCLIIGDSNLSHIPAHKYEGVQIDSYPGAKFSHVEPLLEKVRVNTGVKKVVLSFGINNRDNKPTDTMIQVQRACRAAQHTFPDAEIYVPIVNYADKLPTEQKNNLQTLNQYLVDNMTHIPQLRRDDFCTVRDQIHWSSQTAERMLRHWMGHLNQTSP